jgi:hypothetical protein
MLSDLELVFFLDWDLLKESFLGLMISRAVFGEVFLDFLIELGPFLIYDFFASVSSCLLAFFLDVPLLLDD